MTAIAAAATVATAFPQQAIVGLDLDQYCGLAEESTIISQLDLGSSTLYVAHHPIHGRILLANTTGEQHAAVRF
jgi:hypothetical protein